MNKQDFYKSKFFKVLVTIFLVLTLIYIFQNGYDFGKWLHGIINR